MASLDSEAAALRTQIESLNPWLDLDIPLEQLSFTEDTRLFVGFVPDKEVDAVREGLEPLLAEMKTYGLAPDGQALVVLAHKDAEEGVKHLLKDHELRKPFFLSAAALPGAWQRTGGRGEGQGNRSRKTAL